MAWVELGDLKRELGIGPEDTQDDDRLERYIGASRRYVERQRPELDYDTPDVPEDVWLGTVRLAARYAARRRSPDGLVQLGELGAGRVPRLDQDIAELLGIRRAFTILPGVLGTPA